MSQTEAELKSRSDRSRNCCHSEPGTKHPVIAGFWGPVLVSALLLVPIGCDTQQYSGPVGDFGTACASVVEGTKNGYKLVNDTVFQQEVVVVSEKAGPITDPRKLFQPFLSDEDLSIRNKMLDSLQAYAAALGNLTGKSTSDLDSESTKLGQSLQDLAQNGRLQESFKETKSITADKTNAAAAGLKAIGDLLISHKLASRLPAVLTATEPKIEAVGSLLAEEIGDVPAAAEPGGLREKLWRTYDSLIEDQAAAVDRDRTDSPEKRRDVASLADLVKAQHDSDAALAKTKSALSKLISTHKALLQVGAAPATFKIVLASLVAEAKDVQDYYSKLPSK